MSSIITSNNHTRTTFRYSSQPSDPIQPPPSGNHPPQLVLIIIAQLLKQRRRRLRRRRLLIGYAVHAEMVVHDISDGLRVGGGAGPAAPDRVVHLCQFVGDAVGDVGACGGAGVGA